MGSALKGPTGFEQYYRQHYGERWPILRACLLAPAHHVGFSDGLLREYYMDAASLEVAMALPLSAAAAGSDHLADETGAGAGAAGSKRGNAVGGGAGGTSRSPDTSAAGGDNDVTRTDPHEATSRASRNAAPSVLDMCAAPGGKSLVLATRLPSGGELIANERSSARRARLHRVLDEHLPGAARNRVTVTGHDARRWGLHEEDAYDAILLDAPCSSERHTLASEKHLAEWSAKRPQRIAADQTAMLQAALTAVRAGGHVLYVTCALTPVENDGVVGKVLRRREGSVTTAPLSLTASEPTEHGVHVLPDAAQGRGPIYAALLRKLE